jgi:hypothetical protein
MKRGTKILGSITAALCLSLMALAQPATTFGNDITKHIINTPSAGVWAAYGANQKSAMVKAPDIPGGVAYRVSVTQASANPWDVGVQAPIAGGIKSGDKILLAFWARVETPPPGQKVGVISAANIQLAAAPYTPEISAPITVGSKWNLHFVSGVAPNAIAAGKGTVQLQVGSAIQVIDLGLVIVVDFGPDYDISKLPQNQ